MLIVQIDTILPCKPFKWYLSGIIFLCLTHAEPNKRVIQRKVHSFRFNRTNHQPGRSKFSYFWMKYGVTLGLHTTERLGEGRRAGWRAPCPLSSLSCIFVAVSLAAVVCRQTGSRRGRTGLFRRWKYPSSLSQRRPVGGGISSAAAAPQSLSETRKRKDSPASTDVNGRTHFILFMFFVWKRCGFDSSGFEHELWEAEICCGTPPPEHLSLVLSPVQSEQRERASPRRGWKCPHFGKKLKFFGFDDVGLFHSNLAVM